jgi:hypothetical protein
VAAVLAVSGCTSGDSRAAVVVTAVPTGAPDACRRFAERLPADLGDGATRRRTSPAGPHVAAYGDDPPIVVRCGGARSAAYEPGDELININGVQWFPEERADEVVWSLPRSFTDVQVTIPKRFAGDRLALLTDAVRAAGN